MLIHIVRAARAKTADKQGLFEPLFRPLGADQLICAPISADSEAVLFEYITARAMIWM
jgi:hypothetical protein